MNEHDNLFLQGQLTHCLPEEIDLIWADGWRNFGSYFFRNQIDYLTEKQAFVNIIPLRINIAQFSLRKKDQKLLRKYQTKIETRYQKINITPEIEAMFHKHTQRFRNNIPDSIYDFLGESPGLIPCEALECSLYDEKGIHFASSFFGVGQDSISSIYALFDTDYSERSPGLYTLLEEIRYAQEYQKRYIYLGYAHDVPSFYDYKKQFNGLEYYDWQGNWQIYK